MPGISIYPASAKISIPGDPPQTAQDAAALGIMFDTPYEAFRTDDTGAFTVADPAPAAPILSNAALSLVGGQRPQVVVSSSQPNGMLYVWMTTASEVDEVASVIANGQSFPVTTTASAAYTLPEADKGASLFAWVVHRTASGLDSSILGLGPLDIPTTPPDDLQDSQWGVNLGPGGLAARLTLNDAPDNGGEPSGFELEYRVGAGGTWVSTGVNTAGGSVVISSSELTEGVANDIFARMVNALGSSAISGPKQVTPSASSATITFNPPVWNAALSQMQVQDVAAENTTGPYFARLASHPGGTTLSQSDILNGTGDVLEVFEIGPQANIEDLDRLQTFTTEMESGRLSVLYYDSANNFSGIGQVDGVTVTSASAVSATRLLEANDTRPASLNPATFAVNGLDNQHGDMFVRVALFANSVSFPRVTSITIGSTNATLLTTDNSDGRVSVAIARIAKSDIPQGASTITVNVSGTAPAITMISVTVDCVASGGPISETALVASTSGTPLALDLNTVADGMILGVAAHRSVGGVGSFAWSGAAEISTQTDGNEFLASFADTLGPAAATPHALSVQTNPTSGRRMVSAVFIPPA